MEVGFGRGTEFAGQVTFLRIFHIPRMTASPESLLFSGGDLDSSQLQMEPDEVDTLREGEDPGTQEGWPSGRGGGGAETSCCLYSSTFLLADRMHPFLAIYDLRPLKMHPLVFAPGVPVTAQVVGTERYTSGSKVARLAARVEGTVEEEEEGEEGPRHGFLHCPGPRAHLLHAQSWARTRSTGSSMEP